VSSEIGSVRDEFEQEAAALKQIIYEMIDGSHIIMAAEVFEQYSLLNPADPDLDEIRGLLYPGEAKTQADAVPEEYKILNDIETVFILSGIITKRTGYIDSVLRKIMLMEQRWNYRPILLTCIHNIENRKAVMWLKTAGFGQAMLSADARVINVYEFFQRSYVEGLSNKAVFETDKNGKRYVKTSEGVYDVFDGDALVRKEYYTGYMGSLRMVRYFDGGNKEKDMIYDDWGYLNCVREYSPLSEDIYDEAFYTTDGELCIEALHRIDKGGHEVKKLILHENGGAVKECADDAELAALCLERLMADDKSKFYMLVVEDGLMSKAAAAINESFQNTAKCEVVHNIFLKDAYDPKSGAQMYYKYLCENHEKFDAIIMLTEEAKRDFTKLYGDSGNMFVVPHPYPYEIDKLDFSLRDTKKAVVVARLDTFKQIPLAVDIFSIVVKHVPDAKLEIYGRGMDEEKIHARISQHSLENNVFLKGYTDDPLCVFKTAALSMMTSSAEGFGLTLMESICNGCPAFAFDIKYGPSEIIEDGRTGFLFPKFDLESFARKMIEFFDDINMQKAMSDNCYDAAHGFSTDRFMGSWFDMTGTLYLQHKRIGGTL